MPELESGVEEKSGKRLIRKQHRSIRTFAWHKAAFIGEALPKYRAIEIACEKRLNQLFEGIDMIVGKGDNQQVVHIVPDDAIAKIGKLLIDAREMRRQLLGFPSPGRRRDESEREKSANAQPGIVEIVNEPAPAQSVASPVHAGANDVGQAVSMAQDSRDNAPSITHVNQVDAKG